MQGRQEITRGRITVANPYEVLGVSPGASDDDIKKAYRNLSRRYHPDANINNPNREQAEERFKEVQQAYDQIMKEKQQGYSYDSFGGGYGQGQAGGYYGNFGGFGGFRGFSGTYGGDAGRQTRSSSDTDAIELQAAANYINHRCYREALNVLSNIKSRTATWYYYSAMANAGAGNNVTAKEHIAQACAMEPNNMQYRAFEQQLTYGGDWYSNMGRGYARPFAGSSSFCLSLCLMNLFCNCCCNPFGFRV